jgi:hypothetical protein
MAGMVIASLGTVQCTHFVFPALELCSICYCNLRNQEEFDRQKQHISHCLTDKISHLHMYMVCPCLAALPPCPASGI